MSLKTRTIKGIGWSAMSQITRTLLILGITTALARLLNPNDFGLIAMVAVFANFFVILDDMGLPAAIIYKMQFRIVNAVWGGESEVEAAPSHALACRAFSY